MQVTEAKRQRARLRGLKAMRRLYYLDGKPFTVEQLAARLGLPPACMRARLTDLRKRRKPVTWEALRCGVD